MLFQFLPLVLIVNLVVDWGGIAQAFVSYRDIRQGRRN
jgi:hypothetical protein